MKNNSLIFAGKIKMEPENFCSVDKNINSFKKMSFGYLVWQDGGCYDFCTNRYFGDVYLQNSPNLQRQYPAQQICNTDALMQNFCFQTDKTKKEIIAALICHSIYDIFGYNYDPQTDIIHFFDQLIPGYDTRYQIIFLNVTSLPV